MLRLSRLNQAVVIVRRVLLGVLVLLLSIYYGNLLFDRLEKFDPSKALKGEDIIAEIEVGRSLLIDDDKFTVDNVFVTPKKIMLQYTYRTNQTKYVWSFPTMSLKLKTTNGQTLNSHSAGSSGAPWGERGYIVFDTPTEPTDRVHLIYDRYDRYVEIEIPLVKAGDPA